LRFSRLCGIFLEIRGLRLLRGRQDPLIIFLGGDKCVAVSSEALAKGEAGPAQIFCFAGLIEVVVLGRHYYLFQNLQNDLCGVNILTPFKETIADLRD